MHRRRETRRLPPPRTGDDPIESIRHNWDYLVLTASNNRQAVAYEEQVRLRQRLRFLAGTREALVVADLGGRTTYCPMHVLNRELAARYANLRAPAPGAYS